MSNPYPVLTEDQIAPCRSPQGGWVRCPFCSTEGDFLRICGTPDCHDTTCGTCAAYMPGDPKIYESGQWPAPTDRSTPDDPH